MKHFKKFNLAMIFSVTMALALSPSLVRAEDESGESYETPAEEVYGDNSGTTEGDSSSEEVASEPEIITEPEVIAEPEIIPEPEVVSEPEVVYEEEIITEPVQTPRRERQPKEAQPIYEPQPDPDNNEDGGEDIFRPAPITPAPAPDEETDPGTDEEVTPGPSPVVPGDENHEDQGEDHTDDCGLDKSEYPYMQEMLIYGSVVTWDSICSPLNLGWGLIEPTVDCGEVVGQ